VWWCAVGGYVTAAGGDQGCARGCGGRAALGFQGESPHGHFFPHCNSSPLNFEQTRQYK